MNSVNSCDPWRFAPSSTVRSPAHAWVSCSTTYATSHSS
ncbi:hypothetical protein ATPR_3370 [Acetobacter tropicalis NBRC 101654]|uniref:Uncharacterized protein n=1 Tax=Acetobacter tropicalis NBRC 101654 TaxID=749388 RepID=F7VJ21_9PROT|nr:hypothetical protein ATPR_3370 [Acetobacter tropicalis NBRC 101654]